MAMPHGRAPQSGEEDRHSAPIEPSTSRAVPLSPANGLPADLVRQVTAQLADKVLMFCSR